MSLLGFKMIRYHTFSTDIPSKLLLLLNKKILIYSNIISKIHHIKMLKNNNKRTLLACFNRFSVVIFLVAALNLNQVS